MRPFRHSRFLCSSNLKSCSLLGVGLKRGVRDWGKVGEGGGLESRERGSLLLLNGGDKGVREERSHGWQGVELEGCCAAVLYCCSALL